MAIKTTMYVIKANSIMCCIIPSFARTLALLYLLPSHHLLAIATRLASRCPSCVGIGYNSQ